MSEDEVERDEGFDCAEEESADEDSVGEQPDAHERSLEEDGYGYGV